MKRSRDRVNRKGSTEPVKEKNQHTVKSWIHQHTSWPLYKNTKASLNNVLWIDSDLFYSAWFLKNYSFKYIIDFVESHKTFLYQIHVNSKFVILLEWWRCGSSLRIFWRPCISFLDRNGCRSPCSNTSDQRPSCSAHGQMLSPWGKRETIQSL